MNFTSLTPQVQELLLYSFETKVKILLFVGFLLLSFAYVFYFSKKYNDTKSLLLGILRMINYSICYMYLWLFWFIMPFILNPQVEIEFILLGLISIYSIIAVVFLVLFFTKFSDLTIRFLFKTMKVKEPDFNDGSLMARLYYESKK